MNQRFALYSVLALFAQNALADGLPVDPKTRKITVPHEVLKISESQQDEIDVLGTITFSPQQLQDLRKTFPDCPKRIQHVFPITFSDNIEAPSYAIRIAADTLAIAPFSEVSIRAILGTQSLLTASLEVDRRGQFYLSGVLVPFNQVLELVEQTKEIVLPRDKEDRVITISLPFEMKRDDDVVKSRIDQILREAKKAGAGIRVYQDLWFAVES